MKTGYICLLSGSRLFETAYGEEKFTLSLGSWLEENGRKVVLVGRGLINAKIAYVSDLNRSDPILSTKSKNVRLYPQPYYIFFVSKLYLSLSWILKLMMIHRKTKILVIHATDTGFAGLSALIVGRILGIPVVITSLTIRYNLISASVKGKFNRLLLKIDSSIDKFTSSHADTLTAVSQDMRLYFEKFARRPVTVIPPPIRTKCFRYSENKRKTIREELLIEDNAIVIGFIGRLSAEKNVLSLVKVFNDISKDYNNAILMLVGTGPLESNITTYLKDNGLTNKVRLCGMRADIPSLLSALDIFVQPSFIEGLSLSILEAMASGRAIICSNVSGNRELVTHLTEGLLIDPSNSENMKDAIVQLLNDGESRNRYGLNAASKARSFDEELVFPRINQIYENLMGRF